MECLLISDSRTGKSYKIPVQDNFIQATDVSKVTISDADNDDKDQAARPLQILDRGFENTACMMSSITVMYAMKSFPSPRLCANDLMKGQRGEIRFRDNPIEELFREYVYEDVMHLLIWGALPCSKQKEEVRAVMSQAAIPPETVVKVISAFPFVTSQKRKDDRLMFLTSVAQA